MNASELMYKSAKGKIISTSKADCNYKFEDGNKQGCCYLCGCDTNVGFEKKKIIKPTFTDHQFAKQIESETVCEYCAFSIGFSSLRNFSIFATENKFMHPTYKECRDIILNNQQTPFLLCIATSGQKWLGFKATVNYNTEHIVVSLEESKVRFNKEEFKNLLLEIENIYNSQVGFTKKEIESLCFNSSKILKYGIQEFNSFFNKVEKYKGTNLFKLCVCLAQKEEKNDI